jgi:hypothetical protein
MGSVTGIGSLPLTDPQAAIRLVAQVCPDVPFWPQLPRRSSRERMIEQALGPRSAFFVPRKTGYGYRIKPGLLRVCLHELLDGIAALDEHAAAGFFAFEQAVEAGMFIRAQALKGQLVGPITLACNLFDGEHVFVLNQEYLAAVSRAIARLALWQVQRLQRWNVPVFCFLDEPCLALLTHDPFKHMAAQAVEALRNVVTTLQAAGVLVGIHCCAGQTSFQVMCQTAPDILSFDASQDLETFCADPYARTFINEGGLIAFGLVPTSSDLSRLDPTTLFTRWLLACTDMGDVSQLAAHTLITATCGLGLLSLAQAESTFHSAQHIAALVKKVALNPR